MATNMKSNVTKAAIEASLRKLLQEKSLDEITVKDIVEDCGISRQTFYYHFQDIYAVVDWRFQQLSHRVLEQLEQLDSRKIAVELVLDMMRENKAVLLNVYRCLERTYVERYLNRWSKPVITRTITERAKKYPIDQEALDFVIDLYVFGMTSILLNWLDRGMPSNRSDRMEYFYILLDGGLDDVLRRLSR